MTKTTCLTILPPLLLLVAATAQADIYKFTDAFGVVHLSDKPAHSGYKRIVQSWQNGPYRQAHRPVRGPGSYLGVIRKAAERNRLDAAFLTAVIRIESGFDPNAVSKSGAVGMMQFMPDTARRYGLYNRRDATASIEAGARYLNDLLTMFNDDPRLALAAYNAGENAVIRYGRQIPPFPETQRYVRKVLGLYREYQKTM